MEDPRQLFPAKHQSKVHGSRCFWGSSSLSRSVGKIVGGQYRNGDLYSRYKASDLKKSDDILWVIDGC